MNTKEQLALAEAKILELQHHGIKLLEQNMKLKERIKELENAK